MTNCTDGQWVSMPLGLLDLGSRRRAQRLLGLLRREANLLAFHPRLRRKLLVLHQLHQRQLENLVDFLQFDLRPWQLDSGDHDIGHAVDIVLDAALEAGGKPVYVLPPGRNTESWKLSWDALLAVAGHGQRSVAVIDIGAL